MSYHTYYKILLEEAQIKLSDAQADAYYWHVQAMEISEEKDSQLSELEDLVETMRLKAEVARLENQSLLDWAEKQLQKMADQLASAGLAPESGTCLNCGELVPQGCCTCGPRRKLV